MNHPSGHSIRKRLLDTALAAADRGWQVFPCAPGDKPPALRDVDWKAVSTTDPAQIRDLWSRRPFNIGINCEKSGLVVIDLDLPRHGRYAPGEVPDRSTGLDAFIRICREQGQPVPRPTFTVGTPSGGFHLYYTRDAIPVGSSIGRLDPLIDMRGTGGYVMAPGSIVDGREYTVISSLPLVPMPSWLAELHEKPDPPPVIRFPLAPLQCGDAYARAALRGEADNVASAGDYPDFALNRAAFNLGQLVSAGLLTERDVRVQLADAAAGTGMPAREISKTIERGLAAGQRNPRQLPAAPPSPGFQVPRPREPGRTPRL